MASVFLMIPILSRRNGLLSRAATPIAGVANGPASGTAL
jgi:hypothetical protein